MKTSVILPSILAVFPFLVSSVPVVGDRVETRAVNQPNDLKYNLEPNIAIVVDSKLQNVFRLFPVDDLDKVKGKNIMRVVSGARVSQSGSDRTTMFFSWANPAGNLKGRMCSIAFDPPKTPSGPMKVDVYSVNINSITNYVGPPNRDRAWGSFTFAIKVSPVGAWDPDVPKFSCPFDASLAFEVSPQEGTNITWPAETYGMKLAVY